MLDCICKKMLKIDMCNQGYIVNLIDNLILSKITKL